MRGIHRGPVNSPHKWPVTRKMFPFDDVIMCKMYCSIHTATRTISYDNSSQTPKLFLSKIPFFYLVLFINTTANLTYAAFISTQKFFVVWIEELVLLGNANRSVCVVTEEKLTMVAHGIVEIIKYSVCSKVPFFCSKFHKLPLLITLCVVW